MRFLLFRSLCLYCLFEPKGGVGAAAVLGCFPVAGSVSAVVVPAAVAGTAAGAAAGGAGCIAANQEKEKNEKKK